jgi:hypothetical protein
LASVTVNRIFERLLASAVSELRPSGMIEWTLVHDFVVTTWEIRQLREYKTSFLQVEHVKHCKYQEQKKRTSEEQKQLIDNLKYVRDAANPEIIKEQNFNYFAERFLEPLAERNRPPKTDVENKKLENMSVGETKYNRAFRFFEVISKQVGTIDHLQKMTLMLEKRRDTLLRDLDRRQAARREHNAVHHRHDRDATDIESQV